jgi:hypothetical protein
MDQKDITIAPSSFTLSVLPGERVQLPISITNSTESEIRFSIGAARLPVDAAKKRDLALIEYDAANPSWISGNTIINAPQGKTTTQVTLTIPSSLSSINEYPVIILRQIKDDTSDFSLSTDVAIPVFINIRQQQDEAKTDIVTFTAKESIILSPENSFTLVIKNSSAGEVFTQPKGKIYIYDQSGKRLESQLEINDDFSRLYKDQTLEENFTWKGSQSLFPAFGKYTAVAEVYTGGTNATQKVTASQTFWVIPIFHIVAAIIIAIILLIVGTMVRKAIQKKTHAKQKKEASEKSPLRFKIQVKDITKKQGKSRTTRAK